MDETCTIAELAELAAEVLARPGTVGPDRLRSGRPDGGLDGGPDSEPRASGRVRDVPNERLIRWYGTVGLVDPPLSRRGRVARYGRRHLLQLVAVKRRQAEGSSLAEIQAELAGLTDEALAAVAGIPARWSAPAQGGGPGPATGAGVPAAAGAPASAGPGRFWARQPRQPGAEAPAGEDTGGADVAGADVAGAGHGLVHGIRLAPGVLLLLDSADQEPGPEDRAAIMTAAQPLLRELATRGLGASGHEHRTDVDDPQMGAGNEH